MDYWRYSGDYTIASNYSTPLRNFSKIPAYYRSLGKYFKDHRKAIIFFKVSFYCNSLYSCPKGDMFLAMTMHF